MHRLLLALVLVAISALPVFAQLTPEEAVKKLEPADGLRVQLFAAEPQLYAPTAIDVDERGRVWIVEGVNYRQAGGPRINEPPYFPKPLRKTGDRVMVLEDTDGDGRCDKSRVFYEGLDINSPQGFAVFGGKVWISQSPSIRTIEIKEDGTAGEVKTLLTGFGAIHGDHSVHSVYLGPDGKLYGCFGNDHMVITFPDGKKIDNWSSGVRGGAVFRMNLDATGMIDLAAQLQPNSNAVAYAVTLIEASQSFETRLLGGSDDGLKIWLNGKLVHANNITRSAGPRQDTVTVKFQQGLNRLLVKVNQGSGGWGFIIEVEDPFGALTEVTAAEVLALAKPEDRLDPAKLPPDAELLAIAGDATRGRGIFQRATTALGPALDGIGKKMGRDGLLESIVRPDAKIAPQWLTATVATTAGTTFMGLVAEESPERLVLIDVAGSRTTIAVADIEVRKQSEISVMPQQLVSNLSAQELADLLQYLVDR